VIDVNRVKIFEFCARHAGILNNSSEEHPMNASLSMCVKCDPCSIVNCLSRGQSRKQLEPRDSTDPGIIIDGNEEQPENDESGIDRSLDSDSKMTDAIEVQFEKHDLPRISTE
jgi:hypothetical protein